MILFLKIIFNISLIFIIIYLIFSIIKTIYRIYLLFKYSRNDNFPHIENLKFDKANLPRQRFLETIKSIDLAMIEYLDFLSDLLQIIEKELNLKHKNELQQQLEKAYLYVKKMKLILFLMLHYVKRPNFLWSFEMFLCGNNYNRLIKKKFSAFVDITKDFHLRYIELKALVAKEKERLNPLKEIRRIKNEI